MGLILATDLALALFHNIIQFLSTFVLNSSATNSKLVLFLLKAYFLFLFSFHFFFFLPEKAHFKFWG